MSCFVPPSQRRGFLRFSITSLNWLPPSIGLWLSTPTFLNPSLHDFYEVHNDKGLSDIYLKKAALESCIQSTRIAGLDILTSGPDPSECYRYIGSATAAKMLNDCRSRYEYILIDAPPVRDSPDTAALGSHCDGVALVVRARKTKKQIIQYVQSQLENAGAHELGVILNRMKYWVPGFIYRPTLNSL